MHTGRTTLFDTGLDRHSHNWQVTGLNPLTALALWNVKAAAGTITWDGSHKDSLHDEPRWERRVAHDSHTMNSTTHMHHWIKHDRGRTCHSPRLTRHLMLQPSHALIHIWGVAISTLISAVINWIRVGFVAILALRAELKYLPLFLVVLIHCKCAHNILVSSLKKYQNSRLHYLSCSLIIF